MKSPEYVCNPACPRQKSPDHTSRLASAPARPAATTAGCPGGSVERRCLPSAAGPVGSQTTKMELTVLEMSSYFYLSSTTHGRHLSFRALNFLREQLE